MNDTPEKTIVTVIIPTRGRPQLLAEAVTSVLAQSFAQFEVLVVDDDPQASGREVVSRFNDHRLEYLSTRGGRGAAAARNVGLGRARGRYVAFLDDDDLWRPDFLKKMVSALEGLPAQVGVLHCAVEDVDRAGRSEVTRPRHRGDVHQAMLRGEKSGGIVALVRREVFAACGVFDEELPSAQDWDLWIRVSAQFQFDYIPETLAVVRESAGRISADPRRAIVARERILAKYSDEFDRYPEAKLIHLKRLAKLNSFAGRWNEVWRYFRLAARGRPAEWGKAAAWLVCERPFVSPPGTRSSDPRLYWAALFFSGLVAVYSQWHALRSEYVINDDVCQHLWWMRVFHQPGLFVGDLLAHYARQTEPWGIVGLYRLAALFCDPVAFGKILPLVLLPLTCFFVYRIARHWVPSGLTALMAGMAFAVTPIFLQHLAGGHAHSFGYPLLAAFFYFFLERRPKAMALTLVLAALFFPVIFALGMATWIFATFPTGPKARPAPGEWGWPPLILAAILGFAILGMKMLLFADPLLGKVLTRRAVAAMPELSASGRWEVWPVENVLKAFLRWAQEGIFLFRTISKSAFPPVLKQLVVGTHLGLIVIFVAATGWWRRRARQALSGFFLPIMVASIFLYLWSSAVVLKMYAPDRYLSYSISFGAALYVLLPAAAFLGELRGFKRRLCALIAAGILIVASVPLVRNAGLTDYSKYRRLYSYLATLPEQSLIAGQPRLADGIPVFARRRVWVNFEMSVPLYDRYWQQISVRTREFFKAYYGYSPEVIAGFMENNGISHLVVDKHDYGPLGMVDGIYFEPFASEIRRATGCKGAFLLARLPEEVCEFRDSSLCVVSRGRLEQWVGKIPSGEKCDENPCQWKP